MNRILKKILFLLLISTTVYCEELTYIVFQSKAGFRTDWEQIKPDVEGELILIRNSSFKAPIPKGFDAIHYVDGFNTSDLIDITKAYVDQHGSDHIRIICNDEYALMAAAEVRSILKIPGQLPQECDKFRNKVTMKKIVSDHGMTTPKFIVYDPSRYLLSPDGYLQEVIDTLGLPIFIKPIDGASSDEAAKAIDIEELQRWMSIHSNTSRQFEFDSFISGELYHCDTLIKDGIPLFFGICKQIVPCFDFTKGAPLATYVLDENDPEYDQLKVFHDQVLSAMGSIADGSTHLEVFIDTLGSCIFLEIANRTPGAYVPQCYSKMYDFNFEESAFRLQMDLPHDIKTSKIYDCAYIFFPKIIGTVKKIDHPLLDSKYSYELFVNSGDVFTQLPDNIWAATAKYLLWNTDKNQLRRDLYTLYKEWPIEIESN